MEIGLDARARTRRALAWSVALLGTLVAGLPASARPQTAAPAGTRPTVLFLCPHGAGKSVLASAYFQRLAKERGLNVRVESAGTDPRSRSRTGRGKPSEPGRLRAAGGEAAAGDGCRSRRRGRRRLDWLRFERLAAAPGNTREVGRRARTERGSCGRCREDPGAREPTGRRAPEQSGKQEVGTRTSYSIGQPSARVRARTRPPSSASRSRDGL